MPEVSLYNKKAEKVGTVDLSEAVFGGEVKPHLFHEVVRWQLAKRRSGTASTKTRSEVAGTTQKPYRQKGTGRARRGSMKKSPLFPGGGIAHGPKPKDWSYRLNRKVRAAALRSALSKRVGEQKVFVIEDLEIGGYRTKRVLEILQHFGLKRALIVDGPNEHLERSSRNLPKCSFLRVDGLNVYDILRHEALLISASAVRSAEERLSS